MFRPVLLTTTKQLADSPPFPPPPAAYPRSPDYEGITFVWDDLSRPFSHSTLRPPFFSHFSVGLILVLWPLQLSQPRPTTFSSRRAFLVEKKLGRVGPPDLVGPDAATLLLDLIEPGSRATEGVSLQRKNSVRGVDFGRDARL